MTQNRRYYPGATGDEARLREVAEQVAFLAGLHTWDPQRHQREKEEQARVHEQMVRELAYRRYVDLGRPEGQALEHWAWAEETLREESYPSAR